MKLYIYYLSKCSKLIYIIFFKYLFHTWGTLIVLKWTWIQFYLNYSRVVTLRHNFLKAMVILVEYQKESLKYVFKKLILGNGTER